MTRWQRNLLDVLYISMEAIPWFVAIVVVATIGERGFLTELSRVIRFAAGSQDLGDPDRVAEVVESLSQQAEVATSGPGLWAVALAAFGGFCLMRGLIQLKFGGAFGAIALVITSAFALNILLHVTFAEDLLIWQNEGLAEFIDNPDAFVASGADVQAVVNNGGVVIGSSTAIGVTFAGMLGVWVRFLFMARRPVRFKQVMRSFGIGFAIILAALMVAWANDIGQFAIYALPYFMLGLLALAVANGERAALPAEGSARAASWGVSVTATLSILVVVASLFGLLAFLDVATALAYFGGLLGTVVEWLLIIILTPIFWILLLLLEFLLPDSLAERLGDLQVPDNFIEPEVLEEGEQKDDFVFPRWPFDVLKVLAFVAFVWVSYRVGRSLLARRDADPEDEFDEFRGDSGSGGSGLGGLLRGLMRRDRSDTTAWLSLRPIYGVYGRTVVDAEDRGFERRQSETPLEYSNASGRVLKAPFFPDIAAAFDAARYGGHNPDSIEVERWASELDTWERAHPQTTELRERLEQIRPPSEPRRIDPADEFAQRVKQGKEIAKQMRRGEGMTRDEPATRL